MTSSALLAALPEELYTALDSTAHLEITHRAKLHKSIEAGGLESRLDLATAAPFGYQVSLQHSRGSAWNSVLRGLALALAGRYVHIGLSGDANSDDQQDHEAQRDPAMERHRMRWHEMHSTWGSDHEISLSQVGSLWQGVSWIIRERARNSARWQCSEVQDGCNRQVEELKSYQASVTAAITIMTHSSGDPPAQRRARNKETLTFFLPFWYEHILEMQRQDGPATLQEVANIMGTAGRLHTPAAGPAPPPPMVGLPAHPANLLPFPAAVQVLPPPAYTLPPPAPTLPPAPTPPGTTPPAPAAGAVGPRSGGFVGIPTARVIVGNIGFPVRPGTPSCLCAVSVNFPGTNHLPWECPLKHIQRHGKCAGWLASGLRNPTAWTGDDLTPAARAEWARNIVTFRLASARHAGPDRVTF